jgi:hypothetical protein
MQASPADSNDLSAAPTVVRPSNLMRSANRNLRDLSSRLLHSEPIAFFCECRSPECFSIIWMSELAFDATVSDSAAWLLVEGHEPSEPGPASPAAASADPTAPRQLLRRWSVPLRQRLARSA